MAAARGSQWETVAHLSQEAQAGKASGDAAQEKAFLSAQVAAKQERHVLAGALPEGLRTALGLSMGEPVGQLPRKGSQVDLQAPAPAAAAAAAGAAPSLLSQAEAAAALGAPGTLPPQLAMHAQLAAAAAGGSSGLPGLPTMNPLSQQLYQMLKASMAGAALPMQPPQTAAPDGLAAAAATAGTSAATIDSSALLLGAALSGAASGDGSAAAMAQLLSFRAEAFAVHLCVKLFHCTPLDLPEDVREQLTGWLKAAPACTEMYIRSGCVHLTVTVSTLLHNHCSPLHAVQCHEIPHTHHSSLLIIRRC